MSKKILKILQELVQNPNLASKKWVYEQYDSQVMNNTIEIAGDAALTRVKGTNKALATTSDCTPRYVEADPFLGGMQAVVETYRNISATGATPLAITNCLNFGNPEKPEIMGQIVKAIKGINEACKALNYPVVSGNVSLYNETDGQAIQPTPTIGGVGLIKNLDLRCNSKFKNDNDIVIIIGQTQGHIDCSIYQRDILKEEKTHNPPAIDLKEERKNSKFIRNLILDQKINGCHDVSDGGLLISLFEMCSTDLGIKINKDIENIKISAEQYFFGEDQARYVISIAKENLAEVKDLAQKNNIFTEEIGFVAKDKIIIGKDEVTTKTLINLNQEVFAKQFS